VYQFTSKDIISWRVFTTGSVSVIDTTTNVFTSSSGGMSTANVTYTPSFGGNSADLTISFQAPTFTGGGSLGIKTLVDVKITTLQGEPA
jgi:hypothetical protein